jgi:hypothetical protein
MTAAEYAVLVLRAATRPIGGGDCSQCLRADPYSGRARRTGRCRCIAVIMPLAFISPLCADWTVCSSVACCWSLIGRRWGTWPRRPGGAEGGGVRRAAVVSCWMCGIRLDSRQMMPDGGDWCDDTGGIAWTLRPVLRAGRHHAVPWRQTTRSPGSRFQISARGLPITLTRRLSSAAKPPRRPEGSTRNLHRFIARWRVSELVRTDQMFRVGHRPRSASVIVLGHRHNPDDSASGVPLGTDILFAARHGARHLPAAIRCRRMVGHHAVRWVLAARWLAILYRSNT